MHITISLASNVANELITGCSITERVKRLAGNEIELGIEIPTIESRASNCWKYALEAIIKWLLLYFFVHDNCLLFMLQLCYPEIVIHV